LVVGDTGKGVEVPETALVVEISVEAEEQELVELP
jgi:hypothetical protein